MERVLPPGGWGGGHCRACHFLVDHFNTSFLVDHVSWRPAPPVLLELARGHKGVGVAQARGSLRSTAGQPKGRLHQQPQHPHTPIFDKKGEKEVCHGITLHSMIFFRLHSHTWLHGSCFGHPLVSFPGAQPAVLPFPCFFLRIRVRTLRFRTISIQDDRFCIITTGPRILTASPSSTGHKTKIIADKFNSAFSVI